MAKKTRKAVNESEIKSLTETELNPGELAVIRKLNGATNVPGSVHSRRTIEAVLQGRRSNPGILQGAIHNAKRELERLTKVMNQILSKIRS